MMRCALTTCSKEIRVYDPCYWRNDKPVQQGLVDVKNEDLYCSEACVEQAERLEESRR